MQMARDEDAARLRAGLLRAGLPELGVKVARKGQRPAQGAQFATLLQLQNGDTPHVFNGEAVRAVQARSGLRLHLNNSAHVWGCMARQIAL